MISKEELEAMSTIRISEVDCGSLPDLLDIEIVGNTPEQRLSNYLGQVHNPYCFKVNGTLVKISYSGEKSVENKLKSFFLSLKSDDPGL